MRNTTVTRQRPTTLERSGSRTHSLLVVLFVVYLVLLAWVVLWKLEVPFIGMGDLRHIKLVPFAANGIYDASSPLEVVANIVLFLPFGAYSALLRPAQPLWKHAGTIASASLLLEVGQYLLRTGSSDITDIIANTIGGLTGVLVIALIRRAGTLRITVAARIFLAGTILAVLACLASFASPVHYVQQDVSPAHAPQ